MNSSALNRLLPMTATTAPFALPARRDQVATLAQVASFAIVAGVFSVGFDFVLVVSLDLGLFRLDLDFLLPPLPRAAARSTAAGSSSPGASSRITLDPEIRRDQALVRPCR